LYLMEIRSKSSLLYWHPKINDLGIPSPKTEIIRLTNKEIKEYYRAEGDCFDLSRVGKEIGKVINDNFELPVFLRTDEFSNKHFWRKSCYLDNIDNLKRNLMEIISGSRFADFLGGLPIEALVVREFIPMDTKFHAFYGEMPVNPERRYFIKDGKVQCHHPYWIEDAVKNPSIENWREAAEDMNIETEDEVDILRGYSLIAASVIDGYWSVDFCKAKDGRWILIDMAEGEKSWHPSSCKYSNMPEEKPFEKPDFDSMIVRKED